MEYMGQDMDWPLDAKTLDTTVGYVCPLFTATVNMLHTQYSKCIFDEETDEMVWWPPSILPCNRELYMVVHWISLFIATPASINKVVTCSREMALLSNPDKNNQEEN
jgi:hypothetical protein